MASKPVIFTLDDDPEVLQAIQRDLRKEYGKEYRVMRADGGAEALEALQQMKLRNDEVALFLVDQRMPEISGVEFLNQAREIFPSARRALLTAYADTNAAIQAINEVQLDYYLMKPWDPPEENLYPRVQELLDEWQEQHRPPFEGLRVIGHQWSPDSHRIKDFLARNRVPYQWMNVEADPKAKELLGYIENVKLPVVICDDGTPLMNPTNAQVAEKVGLKTQATQPFYDLAIVGGGPAGLAAAVYGASEGLRTILIEREATGGQAGTSSRIENYLGFPRGVSGSDLAHKAYEQAIKFNVEILTPAEVVSVKLQDQYRILQLSDGSEISCHALMIATGVSYRRIDVMGCDELTGAGIYYGAAMTEAPSVTGQDVFIVGAGNSAGQAAMYFSKYAQTVYMVVRGDSLGKSMSQYLVDQIEATANIKVLLFTEVMAVHGENHLQAVTLINTQTRETEKYDAAALFVFIGAQPRTDWLEGIVERDPHGFVITGNDLMRDGKMPKGWKLDRPPYLLEASVPGIFVAGDVRHHSVKRVASAVGEGSIAVQFIHQYLGEL